MQTTMTHTHSGTNQTPRLDGHSRFSLPVFVTCVCVTEMRAKGSDRSAAGGAGVDPGLSVRA